MFPTRTHKPSTHPTTGYTKPEPTPNPLLLCQPSNEASENVNRGILPLRKYVFTKQRLLLILAVALAISLWTFRTEPMLFGLREPGSTPVPSNLPPPALLEVFQVYPPVLIEPESAWQTSQQENGGRWAPSKNCRTLLMSHSFGFSYGKPFVGEYIPPKCKFNQVTMNFTVTSKGRQFDRLAIMYFNDTEIWRTSTAEPTLNGIHWEYLKDMSAYLSLWNSPQKIIFDLGNLVNDIYTGSFNTTLTATFSMVEEAVDPASLIIPISARRGLESKASVFMLPEDTAANTISFPRNANRAVFAVSACGQATEEFWWANVLQSNVDTFKDETGPLYGFSPFREVQLLIDGNIAGVQWPFPVIFTGGVVPGLWRPIVGIDTFDLREHEIDITPWLPILCDGNEHSFEIRVAGIEDDGDNHGTLTHTVGSSWYVTGKIFIWLDEDPYSITTGTGLEILAQNPIMELSSTTTKNKTGAIETLTYTTNVTRTLSISSLITTRDGTRLSTWRQELSVTNTGIFTNFGTIQESWQETTGIDQSNHYTAKYSYPLHANTSFLVDSASGNFSIDATLVQGLQLVTEGSPLSSSSSSSSSSSPSSSSSSSSSSSIFFSPPPPNHLLLLHPTTKTTLSTTLNGSAHYFASPQAKLSTGYGSTQQIFSFENSKQQTYHRNVEAANGTVTRDIINGVEEERKKNVVLAEGPRPKEETAENSDGDGNGGMVVSSPRQAIGRGPGPLGKE